MKQLSFFQDFNKTHELDKKNVHLWIVDRKTLFFSLADLTEEEKNHFRSMFGEKKDLYIQRKALLRHLLSYYMKIPPLQLEIQQRKNGKPYIKNSGVEFSSSHSNDWLAFAFTLENPIGVDIEVKRDLQEKEDLIDKFFSQSEKEFLHETPFSEKTRRFWEIWNRKEACLKALDEKMCDEIRDRNTLPNKTIDQWSYLPKEKLWVISQTKDQYSMAVALLEDGHKNE